ncbi:MAG: p-cresol methylhydroxylase [SAR86 cluster bacterium]|uniref:p-cresol methylhydroxylase n=1 Tax=SAR86 cluster bacterium TaxID=2030880 RepID=A0A2A5CC44_9GAMM|nr:FAD-binding oxidoreductase [Gammaproteobacteria bacterium AH-315-E17]PCJ41078.1 MAG: p-cresol methylhydroxylase [SAR86 cluster bacterium]
MALPPNLSEAEFAAALREFEAAVGADWVFSSDEDVALYRDSYSIYWGEEEEIIASAAVAPANVEQVQKIVHIANRYLIPIYPISTGRNLNYGGAAPTLTGSVVVDLKRMNRILKVDDKRNFALVEPGVSYFDLYNYIKEHDLKVMLDIPDPGWGSPMGNSLDHGVGYTFSPYRDHFGAHCGLEIVSAEGELIRTGAGAIPGSDAWQDFHYGAGPTIDGLFAQSNFGIVTKMGIKLMPLPETYLSGTVTVPRYQDFQAMIEEVSYLEDSFLIGMPSYDSPVGGTPFGPSPITELMQNGWPSLEQLEEFVVAQNKPAWSVTLQFYGPEETVRANWAAAQRRFRNKIQGVDFQEGDFYNLPIPDEDIPALPDKVRFGIPNLEVFHLVARNPATDNGPPDGHADMFTMTPRTAEGVHTAARVLAEAFQELGFPPATHPFSAPATYYSRAFVVAILLPTWRDASKNSASRELYGRCLDKIAEVGMGTYRTAPAFQDQAVSKYSFNNNALLKFQEKLKDSIDPNGIISPGRYGIWPVNMRNNRG